MRHPGNVPQSWRPFPWWLRPRRSEVVVMLARLRVHYGDMGAAVMLGVNVVRWRRWCASGHVPVEAVRGLWLIYVLTFRPELARTCFDISTWGRFRVDKGAGGAWSDWSI